jgi:hypothetical protein
VKDQLKFPTKLNAFINFNLFCGKTFCLENFQPYGVCNVFTKLDHVFDPTLNVIEFENKSQNWNYKFINLKNWVQT